MRYTEIDLEIEDVMWFAIDQRGHIGCFTSGGHGNIPEFVCRSREDNEAICDYFMEDSPVFTTGKLMHVPKGSFQEEDCLLLVSKGIFSYDIMNSNDDVYDKIAIPNHALCIDRIDEKIRILLSDHVICSDFCNINRIKIT